jgi:uncharacterized protein YcfL
MKTLSILLITVLGVMGCSHDAPNKVGTVRVVFMDNHSDTIIIEYREQLSINSSFELWDYNGSVITKNVKAYSFIKEK